MHFNYHDVARKFQIVARSCIFIVIVIRADNNNKYTTKVMVSVVVVPLTIMSDARKLSQRHRQASENNPKQTTKLSEMTHWLCTQRKLS